MPTSSCVSTADKPPVVVLDTNVVLDLWLFADARADALRRALQDGWLTALVTTPMLAELADVLQRPFARAWPVPPTQVVANLQAIACLVNPPTATHPPAPRCSDGDDQKFIDLAWAWPATLLFSRDQAVLKLARAAGVRGLQITTPERWAVQHTGS